MAFTVFATGARMVCVVLCGHWSAWFKRQPVWKVNPVRLITRPVVVESTFAQSADSERVSWSPPACCCIMKWHALLVFFFFFFSAALSKVSLFSQGQRSRWEDNIDIHAARSDGVTSGCPIPHMSVSTVSLVAGEMWGHLFLRSFTDVLHFTLPVSWMVDGGKKNESRRTSWTLMKQNLPGEGEEISWTDVKLLAISISDIQRFLI